MKLEWVLYDGTSATMPPKWDDVLIKDESGGLDVGTVMSIKKGYRWIRILTQEKCEILNDYIDALECMVGDVEDIGAENAILRSDLAAEREAHAATRAKLERVVALADGMLHRILSHNATFTKQHIEEVQCVLAAIGEKGE